MLTQERIAEAFISVENGVFPELSSEEYEAFKTTYSSDGDTIFHKAVMRYPHCLPEGFNDFYVKQDSNRLGAVLTVAHTAAKLGNLPEGFDDWLMRDRGERTVAHIFAEANTLPADFPHWGEVDFRRMSVAETSIKAGTLPDDFDDWGISPSSGSDEGSLAFMAMQRGFFRGRESEALNIRTINGGILAHELAKHGSDANKDLSDFKNWDEVNDDGETVGHVFAKKMGDISLLNRSNLLCLDAKGETVAKVYIDKMNELAERLKMHDGFAHKEFLARAGSKFISLSDIRELTPPQKAVFISKAVDQIHRNDPPGEGIDKEKLLNEAKQYKNWRDADAVIMPQFKWVPYISANQEDASRKIDFVIDSGSKRDSVIPAGLEKVDPRDFQKKPYEELCKRFNVDPFAPSSRYDLSLDSIVDGSVERGIAEKMVRVFGRDTEKAVRFIENHPRNKDFPEKALDRKLHDAELILPDGKYNKEAWAGFLAKFPEAHRSFASADLHDEKYGSLPNGPRELESRVTLIGYGGLANEHPELAKLASGLGASRAEFEKLVEIAPNAKSTCFLPDVALIGERELEGFRLRKLGNGDPKALLIGMSDLSSCCQRIGGAGEASAIHSYTQPSSAVYVVENTKNGDLVAQTWAWMAKDGKTIVLDSIESKYKDEAMVKATQAMIRELAIELKQEGFRTLLSQTKYGMTRDVAVDAGFVKPGAGGVATVPRMLDECLYSDCKPGSIAHSMDKIVEDELKVRTHHTSRVGRDIEKLPPIHLVKWDKRQDDIEIKKTVKGFKAEIAFTKDGDDVLIKVRAGNKEGLIANEVRRVHIAEKGVTWTQAKEIEEYKAAALRMVERRASLPDAQRTKLMTAIAQQSQASEPKAAKEEGRIPSRFSRAPDVREERPPERERRPAARSM